MDAQPVIVGVDGSPDSLRALQWAHEHARRYEVPLHAVSVFDVPPVYGPYAMAALPDVPALEERARTVLEESVREALGEDAQVTRIVQRGHPARALVAASDEAGLIVVGSRGHGGFVGLMLGSVSQYCVSHARCPVIVLPHGDEGR